MNSSKSLYPKLVEALYRDRWVYYTYAFLFTLTVLVFIKEGLYSKARFSLYNAEFYILAITSAILIMVGYFFVLMFQKNPYPLRAFANQFNTLIASPHKLIAFIVMLTATSFMLSVFTSIKVFIPHFLPFAYDEYYANLDRILHFGYHPWTLTHSIFDGPVASGVINVFYNLWFFLYWMSLFLFMLRIDPLRDRLQYLITHILCWIIIGGLLATLMSSAGPVYYHHFVAGPDPYANLMTLLNVQHAWLLENTSFLQIWALPTQDMIWENSMSGALGLGNGISAMPSLHISVAVLMALAMGRIHKYLGLIFWAFALMILIGSVHLAWHYAIDGYVSGVLTIIIWKSVGIFLPDDKIGTTSE